jgi:hypothetical protein
MLPLARPSGRSLLAAAFAFAGLTLLGLAAPAGCAEAKPCKLNSDCAASYCDNGVCKKDCVDAEADCPKGYTCNGIAKCEAPDTSSATTGAGGSGGSTSSAGGGTTTTVGPGGTTTSATTGVGGGNPGGKTILDPCSSDAQCAANLVCRPYFRNGTQRCLPKCAGNGACPAGTRCETLNGSQYCAGEDVGRTCTTGSTCNFACIPGPNYCTMQCSSGADCPNGYGCMPIGNPPTSVCVKAEAPCSPQDASACVAPSACDTSPTLIVGGCTTTCSSAADCPRRANGLPPWSCDGLCRRPSDVLGPIEGGAKPAQYACNAQSQPANLCNDNQHIDFDAFSIPNPPAVNCNSPTTTDGLPGDSCLDSCRYQGGCHFGFGCTAVGGVGNERIGLCLPTGAGEVGTPCSIDGQCAFAYCAGGKCSRDCTFDGLCPTGSTCLAAGGPAVEGAAFKRCQ